VGVRVIVGILVGVDVGALVGVGVGVLLGVGVTKLIVVGVGVFVGAVVEVGVEEDTGVLETFKPGAVGVGDTTPVMVIPVVDPIAFVFCSIAATLVVVINCIDVWVAVRILIFHVPNMFPPL
jgi:hypothetical protein